MVVNAFDLDPGVIRAALREEAVGILVDAFSKPVVDAVHVAGGREEGVDAGQRGADDPAVIGRVNPARDEGLADTEQKFTEDILRGKEARVLLAARHFQCRGEGFHDEAGIGRRGQIPGVQRTVGILGVEKGLGRALH